MSEAKVIEQTTLLPCPFCGGPAKAYEAGQYWFVACGDDYCHFGPTSPPCPSVKVAAKVWNRRA